MRPLRSTAFLLAALAMSPAAAQAAIPYAPPAATLTDPFQHSSAPRSGFYKHVSLSQRQRRKYNRQRHAAGDRNAFA